MQQRSREPIFNVPAVVVGLATALVIVHAVRELLSDRDDVWLVRALGFIPARYSEIGAALPGAPWAAPVSFVSHIFVHGDLMHLGVNCAWLLAVGSPIARRMPPTTFLAFAALCGVGGAVFFLTIHPTFAHPMVGASGAISGLMGAVFRLMFAAEDADSRRVLHEDAAAAPRLSLRSTFTSRRAVLAILIWVGINVLAAFGLGDLTSSGAIAWEAHVGGFFTGLLTFDLFDRGNTAENLA